VSARHPSPSLHAALGAHFTQGPGASWPSPPPGSPCRSLSPAAPILAASRVARAPKRRFLSLKEQTDALLKTLTPREERVIKMRFGIGDGSEHTLEEVGQSFQVTRERIRQIEAKALRRLRHPSRSRKLKAFLEGSRI
jgi:hypothetical protein